MKILLFDSYEFLQRNLLDHMANYNIKPDNKFC